MIEGNGRAPHEAVDAPAQSTAPRVSVVAPRGLAGALTRYRVMAFVTGVVLATMTIALVVVYATTPQGMAKPTWYGIGWMAHGWLYVVYVATGLDLVFRLRWNLVRAVLILLAGTIPFMSFVAERYVTHRVRPVLAALGAQQGHAPAAREPGSLSR